MHSEISLIGLPLKNYKPTKKMRTKVINGKKFEIVRPGFYRSFDQTIGIYHVMAGTQAEQWEIYEDNETAEEPMDSGDLIAYALTMKEAIKEWKEKENICG